MRCVQMDDSGVRGHETRARWDRQTPRMWNEWVAQRGIRTKAESRRKGERAVREEPLVRGEREKARPGILLCAPLGLKGPRGKVQSTGRAVVRCASGYVPAGQHPGSVRTS